MARTAQTVLCLIYVIYFLYFGNECYACEMSQTHNGCKIEGNMCLCGYGCKSEYRYNSRQECRNALKARGTNICLVSVPCYNNGSCTQVSQDPGFKCRCENTGYFGQRCEKACPTSPQGGHYPYECIVI